MTVTPDRFVACGDCHYCDPDFYDGDDECGESCHPGEKCDDTRRPDPTTEET